MKTVLITKSCYCSLDNSTLFKLEFLSENEKLIDARLCEISTIVNKTIQKPFLILLKPVVYYFPGLSK